MDSAELRAENEKLKRALEALCDGTPIKELEENKKLVVANAELIEKILVQEKRIESLELIVDRLNLDFSDDVDDEEKLEATQPPLDVTYQTRLLLDHYQDPPCADYSPPKYGAKRQRYFGFGAFEDPVVTYTAQARSAVPSARYSGGARTKQTARKSRGVKRDPSTLTNAAEDDLDSIFGRPESPESVFEDRVVRYTAQARQSAVSLVQYYSGPRSKQTARKSSGIKRDRPALTNAADRNPVDLDSLFDFSESPPSGKKKQTARKSTGVKSNYLPVVTVESKSVEPDPGFFHFNPVHVAPSVVRKKVTARKSTGGSARRFSKTEKKALFKNARENTLESLSREEVRAMFRYLGLKLEEDRPTSSWIDQMRPVLASKTPIEDLVSLVKTNGVETMTVEQLQMLLKLKKGKLSGRKVELMHRVAKLYRLDRTKIPEMELTKRDLEKQQEAIEEKKREEERVIFIVFVQHIYFLVLILRAPFKNSKLNCLVGVIFLSNQFFSGRLRRLNMRRSGQQERQKPNVVKCGW
jgi:hypothetical protein